ncbi:conserved hypothetical protein [Streptomyces sp. Mg1]|nr:conserved hypothetical protein [Streptomyces sp. Mg1]
MGDCHKTTPSRSKIKNGRQGSSPRARGAVEVGPDPGNADGVIPAGAGNRPPATTLAGPCGGHPLGCGEQQTCPTADTGQQGSSPRVRGAGQLLVGVLVAGGVIPAGAGSN